MKITLFTIACVGCFVSACFAATVGNSSDMSLPEESLFLKNKAVAEELDLYEVNMNIKASVDVEIVTQRKLKSSVEVSNAKLENQALMFKLSNNFSNVFEPYVKIGTSNFEAKWSQNGHNITVDSDPGFVWGMGAKAKVAEFENQRVKVTLDAQYRISEMDVDKIKIDGDSASYMCENFNIRELALSLIASKKYIFPVGYKDWYIVPYLGATFCNTKADVAFTQPSTGLLYSTYDASDRNPAGMVLGLDIMSSISSAFLWSFELRLINETAFSIGGTMKF